MILVGRQSKLRSDSVIVNQLCSTKFVSPEADRIGRLNMPKKIDEILENNKCEIDQKYSSNMIKR